MKSSYIFTEVVNCGKIGAVAIKSYLKHHDMVVHVYGTAKDFQSIPQDERIVFIDLDTLSWGREIMEGYKEGHLGTARLWAKLVQELTTIDNLIHFDSDVIFMGNLITEIMDLGESYELVGQRRCYKNNVAYNSKLNGLPDVVGTSTFSFNRNLVTTRATDKLTPMMRGTWNPAGHPVIDFFDPVSFEIIRNGGAVSFLDHDVVGGTGEKGDRNNIFAKYNNMDTPFKIDFGLKVAHFSAVGSGMNFFENKDAFDKNYKEHKSYVDYAIDRYALFCKIFYDEDIGIDISKYEILLDKSIPWY